ncbi:MAG: CBS domain-containing protein [Propionibacteriales bacterium]|nr:CBS domain-containing protein [Propionibacteriales bacterium]
MRHLTLTAAEVMTRHPETVGMDDRLERVRTVFQRRGCHHVLVLEDRKVVGVLSERDLLRALSPNISTPSATGQDLATLSKKAHQVMTYLPVVATADTLLPELVDAMRTRSIGCVPIVDDANHPLGIVTWRDLLFVAYSAEA